MNRNIPKEYLVITIDVECDYDGSSIWRYSNPLTFNAVIKGIPQRLQPLFNEYGAKPTYLIANNVLENNHCVNVLSSLKGQYELGTHLHGEFIEPNKKIFKYYGVKAWDNQYQYPRKIEFAKMQNLTEMFKKKFDRQPISFRAGRFSIGNNTIQILSDLEYKVDTSVTPHVIWKDVTRRLSFKNFPNQPYYPDHSCLFKMRVSNSILEVPISICKTFLNKHQWLRPTLKPYINISLNSRINKFNKNHLKNLLKYHFFKDSKYTPSNGKLMINIMKAYARKYKHYPQIIHNMMFHNVEMYPNTSPYSPSDESCQYYLNSVETVLKYCISNNIRFVTLSELYELYRNKKKYENPPN